MIRIRVIRICAMTALLAASALTGSAAFAAAGNGAMAPVPTTCTVNDVEVTGTTIAGTDAVDDIECDNGVNLGTTVTGGGGTDLIDVDGNNAGTIDGGAGADLIDVDGDNLATGVIIGGSEGDIIDVDDNAGKILGGAGGDVIFTGANTGTVDGEADADVCLPDEGAGPTTCETVV
ncbi:hypothetical protein OG607_32000 [Streptomyces sp. NBC_01537]|uniref:hypothetical protein n=1 Tax=Streptomyces sp. NBC_01537 TaxID=2903896 RepID=UPI003865A405